MPSGAAGYPHPLPGRRKFFLLLVEIGTNLEERMLSVMDSLNVSDSRGVVRRESQP
jgi:hypothetical protein